MSSIRSEQAFEGFREAGMVEKKNTRYVSCSPDIIAVLYLSSFALFSVDGTVPLLKMVNW